MRKDYFRYYKPGMLISVILILSFLSGWTITFLSQIIDKIPECSDFKPPTVSAIIMGIFVILDKYGLKTPLIKKLFWVSNISGRYEGEIKYKNPITQEEETKPCAVEIKQTASFVKVKSYFEFNNENNKEKTESFSLVSSIIEDEDGSQELVFTYYNKGKRGLAPSNGTNILKILKQKDGKTILDGVYYTDREPNQTKGEMRVEYKSNKLKNEY